MRTIRFCLSLPLLCLLGMLAGHAAAAMPLTISGSSNGSGSLTADDDLDVYLNGNKIFTDPQPGVFPIAPIQIVANVGDTLRFVVRDTFGTCSSLKKVYLTNATGQSVLADPGFDLGCGRPLGDLGVTHDYSYVIPDFSIGPGDILVAAGFGLVAKVNPTSGMRTLVSDFTNAAQGPTGFPGSLAAGACGVYYATDQNSDATGKLFRVAPNGTRTLLSDAVNAAQGAPWQTPFGLGLDSDGSVLVTDRGNGGGGNNAGLWSVDPATGARTKIMSSGNGGHASPESVMLDAGGNIVVGDAEGPLWAGAGIDCWTLGDCGALFRVNRGTGAQTLLSDFGNLAQGPRGEDGGHSIALDTDDTILVVDAYAAAGNGALFRVDLTGPPAGARTVLTTGLTHQGSVAIGGDGTILLGGCYTPQGVGLCRVDRVTGAQTVLSDFGDLAQGPTGYPLSIAVVQPGPKPFADAQSANTDVSTPLPVLLTGSDPGSAPLTFAIATGPAHGTLTGAAPNLTYHPVRGYKGPDSFTYVANNGCGDSAPATVAITVRVTLDIDASVSATRYDALTDGLLILRYLFGLSGPSLTSGALGGTASRTDPTAIRDHLDDIRPSLDVDGNGVADALTDGLLILRYLFGLRDDALIAGAVGPLATRSTAADIQTYIASLRP